MKDLIFLPDRVGHDTLTAATGFVRLGTDERALQDLADRLVVREISSVAEANAAAWRGTLAIALLADVWADCDVRVSVLTVDAATSPFAAWVLAAQPDRQEMVRLVLLEADGQRKLLGVADAANGLILPQTASVWGDMLPLRARWYDRDTGMMGDPTPYLSETDRMLLQKRMRLMGLTGADAVAFSAALDAVGEPEREALRNGEDAALSRLTTRMQAVHGLSDFAAFSIQEEAYAVEAPNALVRCFCDQDISALDISGPSVTYLWEGIPFARADSRVGLTDTASAEQAYALNRMAAEIAMMAANSTAWARKTARSLSTWLDRNRLTLLPAVRTYGDELRQRLSEAGRQMQSTVTLTWPWDASSGAVGMLLKEALGEKWTLGAAAPFADRLTKLTAHALGDTVLQNCCACADGVLLPPLSAAMAKCVAAAKDGEGLAADALRFLPREDGGITASFLLRGAGEVLMQRTYTTDEMAFIAAEDVPTVAVWPCVPMEKWHAYHVFSRRGSLRVETLRADEWTDCPNGTDAWRCLHTDTYPACLVFMQDDQCLGALPNLLPECTVAAEKEAVAAIDLGTATTSAALVLDTRATPIREEEWTRLLVMPQEMQPDELLLSLTPRATRPTAVALTGDGEELFVDGHIDCPANYDALAERDASTLRTALKWRADATSVRARKLLLQQVMLGVSLSAMMEGAANIRWRVTVADEMDDEGRKVTLDMMTDLALATSKLTGLPLKPDKPAVTWAEEAAALCAYLRGDGGIRGSFTALDMGSGSTKMHLWMQGQSRPAAGTVLLEGTQTLLLAALRAHPEMLAYDFADFLDESLQDAMQALEQQLSKADLSLAEADKAQLMLNTLLDEYRQPITQHLYARAMAQRPTYMQAVLLENQAAMMFIAGLMLEQVGSDTLINHKLPEDMTICLTGRGAWLLDSLTPAQRNALQQIPRKVMRIDNPVRFVTLKAAPQPTMSTALGMAFTKELERTLNPPQIRTRTSFSQLMRDMLVQFIAHYPMHAWVLHEGLFDASGVLTPAGEETIRLTAARCYGDGDDIPASVLAFVKEIRQLPVPNDLSPMEVFQ